MPEDVLVTARKGTFGHGMSAGGGWELTAQYLGYERASSSPTPLAEASSTSRSPASTASSSSTRPATRPGAPSASCRWV